MIRVMKKQMGAIGDMAVQMMQGMKGMVDQIVKAQVTAMQGMLEKLLEDDSKFEAAGVKMQKELANDNGTVTLERFVAGVRLAQETANLAQGGETQEALGRSNSNLFMNTAQGGNAGAAENPFAAFADGTAIVLDAEAGGR